MALDLPVFYKRTASAIVFAIVMLVGLLTNSWAFLALISAIQILCFRDYFHLMIKIAPDTYWPKYLKIFVQTISLLWLWSASVMYSYQFPWPAFVCALACLLVVTVMSKKDAWQAGLQSLTGMVYIMLPMILLSQMHTICKLIPIAVIVMIWTSDTMAYLVGSFIGKTPFSPVSPKKSWEGIIGGAILTIVAGGIWGYYSHYYNIIDWMVLALIVSIAGPLGDLVESKLKRMANVKDSGNLMPGHGGALDRFDSLLIAVPFTFCYAWFFMPSIIVKLF